MAFHYSMNDWFRKSSFVKRWSPFGEFPAPLKISIVFQLTDPHVVMFEPCFRRYGMFNVNRHL